MIPMCVAIVDPKLILPSFQVPRKYKSQCVLLVSPPTTPPHHVATSPPHHDARAAVLYTAKIEPHAGFMGVHLP